MASLADRESRLAAAARYLAISRFIADCVGRSARPSSKSATQCDCASAIGMIAPIGWTSPMKYSPGTFGETTRR